MCIFLNIGHSGDHHGCHFASGDASHAVYPLVIADSPGNCVSGKPLNGNLCAVFQERDDCNPGAVLGFANFGTLLAVPSLLPAK